MFSDLQQWYVSLLELFWQISIIFPPSNLIFSTIVLIQKFSFSHYYLFIAQYMQLHHWWCFVASCKTQNIAFHLKVFLFVPVSRSQPDWRPQQPQLHVCRVAVKVTACFQFERLLIFMSDLFNSPNAHRSVLRGDTPPLFISTCRRRPPRRPNQRVCCLSAHQIQLAATVADVLQQNCTLLAVPHLNSKLITNMRNETINSWRMKIKLWTRIKSSRIKDLNLKIIQPLIINKSPSSYNGNP